MAVYTEEVGGELKVYCDDCDWVGTVDDLEQGECPVCESGEIYTLDDHEEVEFGVSEED